MFFKRKLPPIEWEKPDEGKEYTGFKKEYTPNEIAYIERTIKCMAESLKQAGMLPSNFEFVSKAERENEVEKRIEDFIKNY